MIISVSRRTDIPAFYTDWFTQRLKAGYCCVQNPMNRNQVRRVSLTPETVDAFVFWTRNGTPLLNHRDMLKEYPFYFQWTLTAFGKEIEPYLPTLEKRLEQFKTVADTIGPDRMVWRYDPIFFSKIYSVAWHREQFERISTALRGYTHECIFSFYDPYKKCEKAMQQLGCRRETSEEIEELARGMSEISKASQITLSTCAEQVDLSQYHITHGACIDLTRIERISGRSLQVPKDKNQRKECRCVSSIDIGAYHSCSHLCVYCYANSSEKRVRGNVLKHNPDSPLLIGDLMGDETILEK